MFVRVIFDWANNLKMLYKVPRKLLKVNIIYKKKLRVTE